MAKTMFESIFVANAPLDAKALSGGSRPKLYGPTISVTVFDVGPGEAILLNIGKEGILVDGGSVSSKKRNDSEAKKTFGKFPKEVVLRAVIASHPHQDHTNFYPYMIQYETKLLKSNAAFYDNATPPADRQWDDLTTLVKDGFPLKRMPVETKVSLNFGSEAYLLRSKTGAEKEDGQKYWSVFLVLRYNDAWFLFTGDAMRAYEENMLAGIEGHTNRIHLLKITHHGATSGTSPKLVNRLDPSIAIASSYDDDGHRVEKETRETLHAARVVATYQDWEPGVPKRGDVEVRTDGRTRNLGGLEGILFEVRKKER